jgi:hypothetical protein
MFDTIQTVVPVVAVVFLCGIGLLFALMLFAVPAAIVATLGRMAGYGKKQRRGSTK